MNYCMCCHASLFIVLCFFGRHYGFECQLKEESAIGTVLTDVLNGRPCNVLQKKSLSSSNVQVALHKIILKILPSQENRISTYFEVVNNKDLRHSMNVNQNNEIRNGDILVKKILDRENLCADVGKCCDLEPFCFFELKVLVRYPVVDNKFLGSSSKFSMNMNIEQIRIKLIDINDNSPVFSQIVKNIEISESSQIGVNIPLPLANDPDSRINNILNYRLENHDQSTFTLIEDWSTYDSTVSQIYIKLLQSIDKENNSNYVFYLIATDKGKPPRTGKLKIEVKILDANDNHPIFENNTYSINVKESEIIGHLLLMLKAIDKDSGENGNIMYSFSQDVNLEVRKRFHIDPISGWISISELLDFEKVKYYEFGVIARDSGTDPNFSKATVKISVIDCNDNHPKIYLEYLTESGKRSLPEGPLVLSKEYAIVLVSDPDTGNGGVVKCELKGSQKFELVQSNTYEGSTYKINLVLPLDYEERVIEKLNIVCYDLGEPQLTSIHDEEIVVQDINDNAPVFENPSYHYISDENNQAGVVLLKVQATDRDSGSNGKVSYSLDQHSLSIFSINVISGIIRSKISFDREKRKSYQILVFAKDSGEPVLSGSTIVLITIADLNDNVPNFQGLNPDGSYIFEIKENKLSNTVIGKIYAEDPDEGNNGKILYTFISPSILFSIDQNEGIIRTNQKLDREEIPIHEFIVKVTDKGSIRQENSVSVTVSVIDVNDNEPRIYFPSQRNNSITISYMDTEGMLLAKIEAVDNDEGLNSLLEYQIISGNFKSHNDEKMFYIDKKNGDIFLQRTLTRQDIGAYVLKVLVSDQGTPSLSSSVTFVIKVDNIAQRNTVNTNYKNNQNLLATYSDRSKDDSLSTSVILIVSIALICIIVLVLLTMGVFLCGKRGQEELNEIFLKRSEQTENSTNFHLCFCISKSRNQRKLRTDARRYSEILYNNNAQMSKMVQSSDNGNLSGSLLLDKVKTKGMDCHSYQMSNLRSETSPDCQFDPRYISFQGFADTRHIDEYNTLVSYKITPPNFEKIHQRMEVIENISPTSTKNLHSSTDPIVYIRCQSSPKVKAEKSLKQNQPDMETLPYIYCHYRSGDIICPISNCSKPKSLLTTGRSLIKSRNIKSLRSQFRYPSVPESLNYLCADSTSITDHNEPNDRFRNRLITWNFGKKIRSTPLHRGSFV